MTAQRLLELTEDIYDAGTSGTPWATVGARLARLLRAESALLTLDNLVTGDTELLYRSEFPPEAVDAYNGHYRSVDLWTSRAISAVANRRPGARARVWTSGHLVPDAEFLSSEFYVDFGRRLGLRYVVGTVLPLGGGEVMPVGLHRPEGAAAFDDTERELLECLLPHFRRALQLRRQLAAVPPPVSRLGVAALDELSLGVLVVNSDMSLLVVNAAAEALAADRSVLRIASAGGDGAARTVAVTGNRTDNLALAALVRATALGGSAGGGILLHRDGAAAAVAALVAPLPRRLSNRNGDCGGRVTGQALIFLRDLAGGPAPPPAHLLRDLFGLTAAEAEIARALSGGATKESVAARRGIRVTTVRTQVRGILEKTGAVNLRDLERLLVQLST